MSLGVLLIVTEKREQFISSFLCAQQEQWPWGDGHARMMGYQEIIVCILLFMRVFDDDDYW